MKKWLLDHWYKLISLQASPDAIAAGFAIGIWWGFTPFIGVKTVMAIFFAWISRTNKIAAAIGVTMHDMLLPFFFFVLYFQYEVGCLMLHKHPERIKHIEAWAGSGGHSPFTWNHLVNFCGHIKHWLLNGANPGRGWAGLVRAWEGMAAGVHDSLHSWLTVEAFHRFCLPVILGAVLIGTLLAFISYFSMRYFVTKFQAERALMDQLRKSGIIPEIGLETTTLSLPGPESSPPNPGAAPTHDPKQSL